MNSVLVTGGAGFIGSHLVETLVYDHDVTVLDNLSNGSQMTTSPRATFVEEDVRDYLPVEKCARTSDIIFHQAAVVSVPASIERPRTSHSVNSMGTLHVLEASKCHDVRVVLASSAAIYGHPDDVPIREEYYTNPTSPYGLDKLTADHYTRLYHELYGLDTVALRYFNVFGPGQQPGEYAGAITTFIDQALNNKPITVHGNGEQTRDFIYIDDVVRANLLAAETNTVGQSFNIATGNATSILELAEIIQDLTDTASDIVHVDEREGDIKHSVADTTKAENQLGFEPEVTLEEGLEKTVAWYRSEMM